MDMTGSCSCGQLSITISGGITKTSICHCYACQKRSGSAFGIQSRVRTDMAKISGTSSKYRRIPEDGGYVDFHFCPVCATTLYWLIDDQEDPSNQMAGYYCVAIGAFAEQATPAPVFSVYEDHMLPWVTIPESVTTRMK